ncbi:MAG: class I SAM-dependent methyltransferase [Anaerolineae bacterium]
MNVPILNHALRYEADTAFPRRVQTIFEWLDIQDDDRVLDCGCGRGFYLNFIRQLSDCQLIGVDIESAYLRIAQETVKHFDNVEVITANIYQLPFPDEHFDKVVLTEVLEHLADDYAALLEVARTLRPDGVIAVTVPNANYPFLWDPINKTLESLCGAHISQGPLAGIWANHIRLYDPFQLRSLVEGCGLIVEELRSFTHYAFPFIHNIVYGVGKPLLESGVLPTTIARTADRSYLGDGGSMFDPVKFGLRLFYAIDRFNKMDEPPGRSTVNLCVKARKPCPP